ncbi:MAG: allantoinase AllB [Hamadaea sp.]|nr:allantoinase AllB [Hamadaea sp.]
MTADLVIASRHTVLPDGTRPATVHVHAGRIAAVTPYDPDAGHDLGDVALLPGLVDTHVHVNEPGRTAWEGFATATAAAAAGGVTTIVDMPLNSIPPTTTVAALDLKRAAAAGKCRVDVGFWGGAVPGNRADLPELAVAGVFGFKAFLSPSGVDEFGHLTLGELRSALATVDALFLVHAEDPARLRDAPASRHYGDFLASRPPAAERDAVAAVAALALETGARVHILHVSSADAVAEIAAARRAGARLTAETCPHYLTLDADAIPAGATAYKCCPPIRDRANQDRLWAALAAGEIDMVVSDHSPSPPELKRLDSGDFGAAWGGIASVQLGLPAVWTRARRRGFSLTDVVTWMATRPAEIAGVPGKGAIAVGNDADLVAFDPSRSWTVRAEALSHRHPVTPYHGQELDGVVTRVWLRGVPVDDRPRGRLLAPMAAEVTR